MAQQTGSIDLKATKKAHDDAEKVATNYVTDITNGIMVHPEGDSTTGWKIASALELLKSGVTYIKAWLAGTNNDTPTVQIGRDDSGHTVIDSGGMRVYGGTGATQLANIGYGEGASQTGTATAPYYSFGNRNDNGVGNYSTAEGWYVKASGYCSHAEGSGSQASGNYSHAEGMNAIASGDTSHAEGAGTNATGILSHAEGWGTTASGYGSHAQGFGTIAASYFQTVIGKFNEEDNQDVYAFIIGNGYNGDPPIGINIFTVDWGGNVEAAGDVSAVNVNASGNVEAGGDVTDGNGNTLSAIATLLSGALKVQSLQIISSSTTIAAGGNTGDKTVTPAAITGYTPILATPRNTGGNGMVNFYKLYMDANHRVVFSLANPRTSSVTFSAAYVNVLYVKNELVG